MSSSDGFDFSAVDEPFDDVDDDDGERLSDEDLEATLQEWDDTVPRLNTIHLTGRIGNDPEPRYFDDGKVVVNLSLAVSRKYHTQERQELDIKYGEEETDWFGLEIWGYTAEYAAKFVDKGMRVGVIGSFQMDEWIDRETNEKCNKAKVIVRDLDILETRAESEMRRGNRRGNAGSFDNGNRAGRKNWESPDNSDNRGPAFYTSDNDDDGPFSSAGTGGFFDS